MKQRFIKEKLYALWQGRFQHGIALNFGGVAITKYTNGKVIAGNGPVLSSPGTQHWPFFLFEIAIGLLTVPSWHVGILGFTFGMLTVHHVDDKGVLLGPDFKKYYWFFKGLNHQSKQLEEII